MPSENTPTQTPLLDEWRAVAGDAAVAAAVEVARRRIADGSMPGFSDERRFLDYIEGTPRRSA